MSGAVVRQGRIKPEFVCSVAVKTVEAKKRPAPVSVRFSNSERERLEADANSTPLGTYIKGRVFEGGSAPSLNKRNCLHTVLKLKLPRASLLATGLRPTKFFQRWLISA